MIEGENYMSKKKEGKKRNKVLILLGTVITIILTTIIPIKLAEKNFKNIRFEGDDTQNGI